MARSESRFKKSAVIRQNDGRESYGLVSGRRFLDEEFVGDRVVLVRVTPEMAHNPSIIAAQIYGNPQLYWVVVLFNKPRSIFRWPELGEVISVPHPDLVLPEI